MIAFTHVDESRIPVFRIMHSGKDSVGPETCEEHRSQKTFLSTIFCCDWIFSICRYPFSGFSNAHVKIGIVDARGEAEVALFFVKATFLLKCFY